MKKLPVGIQSFRQIIEEGFVYADKTQEIYNLIQGGRYYFLSRPRRFGKSLLLDTIAEVFSGNRELFEGLWIGSSENGYGWEPHPVIRVDMTQLDASDATKLFNGLLMQLTRIAQTEELAIAGTTPADLFISLIGQLAAKYNSRAVVLIDEYDKPIIDHLTDPEKARANREMLGSFYGVLKGQDANLQFVLLAGVSKFTKLSLFSRLNNLTDLTLWDKYAGICGITESDLDTLFTEHLEAYREAVSTKSGHPDAGRSTEEIRQKVFDWYDGYTWDGTTRIFNPFSLLSFFLKNQFSAHWFQTGVPTFQMRHFHKRPWEYADVQGMTINELVLDSHDIENAPLVSLLFQTGFLTVKSVEYAGEHLEYRLGFPNEEVSQSFAQLFLSDLGNAADPFSISFVREISDALDAGEPERIAEPLAGLYASIPYNLHINAEAYYQSIFLAVMQFLGFRVLGEVSTAKGRADGVLDRANGRSYAIEFKYVNDESDLPAALDAAFAQIGERGYAERYRGTRREAYKLAIAVAGRGKVAVQAEIGL